MRRLPTSLTACLFVCCLLATAPAAQSPFETALTVNDTPVTHFDIDQRVRLLVFNGAPRTADLRGIAIEQLIEDRLRQEAAARRGIRVNETDLATAIANFAEQRNLAPQALDSRLAQAGASRAALADALAADLVWRDVVRRRFTGRAEPTELEIDQAIALAAAGRNREYRLSELVIPTAARGEAGARSFAQQLSDQLNRGGNFAAAARQHSASVSARDGGAIGWIPEGSLPDPVLDALDPLAPGQVTAPIPVPGALVLLRLEEVRTTRLEEGAMGTVTLLALSVMDPNSVTAAARLDGMLARNPTCESAPAMATAANIATQQGEPITIGDLPEPVRRAIEGVPEGGASGVIPVGGGAAAFIVCRRTDGLSPEARARVRDQLREERFTRFSSAFLQELRNEAIIERR